MTLPVDTFLPNGPEINNASQFVDGEGENIDLPVTALSGLLAYTSYNPTLTDFPTTSTAGEDLDATNLSVTFIVPASGKVLISLCATGFHSTSGVALMFLLRTTGGANVAGTKRQVTSASATTGQQIPICHRFILTGLTPGASVTYRWGVMCTAAGTCHIRYGDDGNATGQEYGPAVMEVWAAP